MSWRFSKSLQTVISHRRTILVYIHIYGGECLYVVGSVAVLKNPLSTATFNFQLSKTAVVLKIYMTHGLPRKFCSTSYTSVKINRRRLKFFLWLILNVPLTTSAQGIVQIAWNGKMRFKKRAVIELLVTEGISNKHSKAVKKCIWCQLD
jgi:hypothetical protein